MVEDAAPRPLRDGAPRRNGVLAAALKTKNCSLAASCKAVAED
jgi:hypothetical protein